MGVDEFCCCNPRLRVVVCDHLGTFLDIPHAESPTQATLSGSTEDMHNAIPP